MRLLWLTLGKILQILAWWGWSILLNGGRLAEISESSIYRGLVWAATNDRKQKIVRN